jgi:hypothetical protein
MATQTKVIRPAGRLADWPAKSGNTVKIIKFPGTSGQYPDPLHPVQAQLELDRVFSLGSDIEVPDG